LLVFVGVYAVGNPIDILISPQADQQDRERAIAALGSTSRCGRSTGAS
jgi:peptide/nickel transport system permease protein